MFAIVLFSAANVLESFFYKSRITPSFVLLFWLMSFTLRLTWICVTGNLAQQRHLQCSHRLSSHEHRKTKQIETFRFCITIFILKSTSWARDPIIMLATTTNSSGIPDKAWQPNFVVIETTWVFEFMPVLGAHSSPITWNYLHPRFTRTEWAKSPSNCTGNTLRIPVAILPSWFVVDITTIPFSTVSFATSWYKAAIQVSVLLHLFDDNRTKY